MSGARDFCLLVGPGPRAYSPKSSQSGSLPILSENGYNSLSPLLHYTYVCRLASATPGQTFLTGSERTRAVFLNRSAPRIAVAKCQTLLWTNDREIHKKMHVIKYGDSNSCAISQTPDCVVQSHNATLPHQPAPARAFMKFLHTPGQTTSIFSTDIFVVQVKMWKTWKGANVHRKS